MIVTEQQLKDNGAILNSNAYLWKLTDSVGMAVCDNGKIRARFDTRRLRNGIELKIRNANKTGMATYHRARMDKILNSLIKSINKLEGNSNEKQ